MKQQKQKANTPAYQEDTEKVSKLKKGEKLLFCMISLFCFFCCFFFLCTLIDRAAECLAGIHFFGGCESVSIQLKQKKRRVTVNVIITSVINPFAFPQRTATICGMLLKWQTNKLAEKLFETKV